MLQLVISSFVLLLYGIELYGEDNMEYRKQSTINKPTIAIFDFKLSSSASTTITGVNGEERIKIERETSILTDKLLTALVKSGKFTVVEREKLGQVLKEIKLSQTGLTDPEHSVKLGKLLNADYLVFGSIPYLEGNVKRERIPYTDEYQNEIKVSIGVDLRVIDAATGKIIAAESINEQIVREELFKRNTSVQNELINQLLTAASEKLTLEIIDTIFPIKVVSVEGDFVYLNRGEGSGIRDGDVFKIVESGKEIIDPDTGEILGFQWVDIALIMIESIQPKLSKAKIEKWLSQSKHIRIGSIVKKNREH